jgi:hypothetical protein
MSGTEKDFETLGLSDDAFEAAVTDLVRRLHGMPFAQSIDALRFAERVLGAIVMLDTENATFTSNAALAKLPTRDGKAN